MSRELKNKVQTKYIPKVYGNILPTILCSKFKKINATVTLRTSHNVQKFLREKQHLLRINLSGVYRLKCDNCPAFYIGQTGREFKLRYKESLPKIEATSNQKSNFAQHLVLINHNYTNFETNLEVIHVCNKGRYLNA